VSTLANAMEVLRLIARLKRDITVTDAAMELNLPKSSASRTLSAMAEYGFLERDAATRAYRPGSVILEASYHFRFSRNVSSLLEDALVALVHDTGYTGYLDVLDNEDSLVIQMRTGTGSLQVYTPPGTRAPAYATSMGRALLARLPDDKMIELVGNRFELRRGNIPRSWDDLSARVAEVRATGWSLSRGEFLDNVAGISASVLDPASGKTYGIGIALPSQEVNDELVERLSVRVRDAAKAVGKQIGDDYWLAFPEAS
jgi:DNA-binding IclR family transcriptional regulator